MPSKCLVLDIETVPSHHAILDEKKPDFPNPIFHKIVCISYALLSNSFLLEEMGSLGLNGQTEKQAIEKIVSLIDKDTIVVTWSGRRFDIPVILYRAMYYGIPCHFFFKNEFDKRFSVTGHFDLQDNMMFYGAAAHMMKLDHVAAVIGLPGKMSVSGGDVEDLWLRNRYLEIGTYCITDVVQLLVLFLKWSFLRGLASPTEVNESLDSVVSYASRDYLGQDIASYSVRDGINQVVKHCDWEALKLKR